MFSKGQLVFRSSFCYLSSQRLSLIPILRIKTCIAETIAVLNGWYFFRGIHNYPFLY